MVQDYVLSVDLSEPGAFDVVCLDEFQDDIAYQVFARLIHGCSFVANVLIFFCVVLQDSLITDAVRMQR